MRTLNIYLLLCFYCLINIASAAQNDLTISYFKGAKKYAVQGIKTAKGYQFNANSTKIINLATLNWPPYISEEFCNKGWVFQFTVALLVSRGYQVNIHFYPWARSVMLVEQGQMDILFPEYFIESSAPSDTIKEKKREDLLALSNEFPGGKISLMKRKDYQFKLTEDLSTLKEMSIGVVRGYQNTPEFDAMMDAEQFSVIQAVDELQLMKLLVAKRVDLIVGDPKVLTYSVNYSHLSDKEKQALLTGTELVEPALKYNYLYLAISKQHPAWPKLLDDINLALLDFKQNGETERFINLGSTCPINK